MPTFTSVQEIFDNMCKAFKAEKAQSDKATIQFDLSGENGGKYWIADGWIWGPQNGGKFWIDNGWIWGPSNLRLPWLD